jgi:hypothetical protein
MLYLKIDVWIFLYRRILGFSVWWGPLCIEDHPHITSGLSFAFGAYLIIGGI